MTAEPRLYSGKAVRTPKGEPAARQAVGSTRLKSCEASQNGTAHAEESPRRGRRDSEGAEGRSCCGNIKRSIHYWVNAAADNNAPQLVFLPGLTADHRLFNKQIKYFEGKYPVFVWDAPGHASSWPFTFDFNLMDKAEWLDEILTREGFDQPVIIGQSMGGYVGQAYAQLFPEKLRGFVSIDSAPLQREYVTAPEICY